MFDELLDFCQKNDGREKGKFTTARKKWKDVEDELLIRAVKKHGRQWSKIQDEVPQKDARQCQARWKILEQREAVQERLNNSEEDSDNYRDQKMRKMKKQKKIRPRKYNPNLDYYEESSSDSLPVLEFQKTLMNHQMQQEKQRQLSQQRKEQQKNLAQSQYQNVWNAMDDKMLLAAYKIYKGAWNQITPRFQEKNPQSCIDRLHMLLSKEEAVISSEYGEGSEQFDISPSENSREESTVEDCKTQSQTQQYKYPYSVQQCYTNITRILKSFSNHSIDTLPGIRESIQRLILTD